MCVSTTSISVVSLSVGGCVHTQCDTLASLIVSEVVKAGFVLLASYEKKVAQKTAVTSQKSGSCTDFCRFLKKK